MTDTGARALAAAIVAQAITDYVECKPTSPTEPKDKKYIRAKIKKFFRSEWFKDLVYMGFGKDVDPQYIVDQTEKKAAAHDAQKARLNND